MTTPYGYLANDGTLSLLYGEVQSRVVRSSVDGTIDLYWQIIPETNPFGVPAVDGFIDGIFLFVGDLDPEAVPYFADWRSDLPGTVAPSTIHPFRGQAELDFASPVTVGNPSRWFFIDSPYRQFDSGGRFRLLEGDNSTPSLQTFRIVVPEPSASLLAVFGIAAARRAGRGLRSGGRRSEYERSRR
jgi:hypothetical protein